MRELKRELYPLRLELGLLRGLRAQTPQPVIPPVPTSEPTPRTFHRCNTISCGFFVKKALGSTRRGASGSLLSFLGCRDTAADPKNPGFRLQYLVQGWVVPIRANQRPCFSSNLSQSFV